MTEHVSRETAFSDPGHRAHAESDDWTLGETLAAYTVAFCTVVCVWVLSGVLMAQRWVR